MKFVDGETVRVEKVGKEERGMPLELPDSQHLIVARKKALRKCNPNRRMIMKMKLWIVALVSMVAFLTYSSIASALPPTAQGTVESGR